MKNAYFISFQCFKISVILKNTEKMKTKKNFSALGQFHYFKKISVSVRNFSEFSFFDKIVENRHILTTLIKLNCKKKCLRCFYRHLKKNTILMLRIKAF